MSRVCPRCGHVGSDDERFCTRCGGNYIVEEKSVYDNYQDSHQGIYVKSVEEEMSFKKWVATVLVTNLLGIISIIFLFVWGFGDGPRARQLYCRAMLIVKAISVGLALLYYIFCLIIFGSFFGGTSDWDLRDFILNGGGSSAYHTEIQDAQNASDDSIRISTGNVIVQER